ncbi:hypothetical protein ACFLWL_01820 [Chloroflexota bacterium]
MGKKGCQVCGRDDETTVIEKHYIVPREVMQQAGIPGSRIVRLCCDCRRELLKWCSTKVADMTYDTRLQSFRMKPPLEMVKEYEFAYKMFIKYKKEMWKN